VRDVTSHRALFRKSTEIARVTRGPARRHRTCKSSRPMKMNSNTGVDDREEWRARIQRALQELQGEDGVSAGRLRRDATTEDAAAESSKF